MKNIKLINSKQGWMARFENDPKIIDLFGTDTIPTPFTESVSPMEVLKTVQAKNPGYKVEFGI